MSDMHRYHREPSEPNVMHAYVSWYVGGQTREGGIAHLMETTLLERAAAETLYERAVREGIIEEQPSQANGSA